VHFVSHELSTLRVQVSIEDLDADSLASGSIDGVLGFASTTSSNCPDDGVSIVQ